MANLGTKTKNINLVIRKNAYLDTNKLNEWFSVHCERYAYIMHEKDINLQGEVEGVHYHCCLIMLKMQRLSTILSSICEYLCINPFGVEIAKMDNLEGSMQYLIHKRNPEKTQHDVSEIVHNWPDNEMKSIMECDASNGSLTFECIYEVCRTSRTLLEVIQSIGLGRYHLYRPVIMDIWKECNNGRKLDSDYLEVINDYNELLATAIKMLNNIKLSMDKKDRRIAFIDKWENELVGRYPKKC